MANDIVSTAFSNVISELSIFSQRCRETIDDLLNRGDFSKVQLIIQKVQYLHQLIQNLKSEEKTWNNINNFSNNTGAEKSLALIVLDPFYDCRSVEGKRFCLPILSHLSQIGGIGKDKEIKNRICIELSAELTDKDWQVCKSNSKLLNWQVDVDSSLNFLLSEGYIEKVAKGNKWGITSKGLGLT